MSEGKNWKTMKDVIGSFKENLPTSVGDKYFYEYKDRLVKLYISCWSHFVLMRPGQAPYSPKARQSKEDKLKGAEKKPQALSDGFLFSHFCRNLAIAIFSVKTGTPFLCFDVDDGNPDTVKAILNKLMDMGFEDKYLAVSTSGGKGYHVELFFDGLVPLESTAVIYVKVCKDLGLDMAKVEYRPSDKLAIKLPLGAHYKTGNICWYLDKKTLEPIRSYDYLFEIQQMDHVAVLKLVSQWRADYPASELKIGGLGGVKKKDPIQTVQLAPTSQKEPVKPAEVKEDAEVPKSPTRTIVDVYHLPILTEKGETYNTMRSIAVAERFHGVSPDDMDSILRNWVAKQDKEFITNDDDEIDRNIKSLVDWIYSPNFNCSVKKYNKHPVTFNKWESCNILIGKTKYERRFLFLLMYYCKKQGYLKMNGEKIGKIIGCTGRKIITIAANLIERGIVCKRAGATILSDDQAYLKDCNTYWINKQYRMTKEEIFSCNVGFLKEENFELPRFIFWNEDVFQKVYLKFLCTVFPMSTLRSNISRAEYAEVKEYSENPWDGEIPVESDGCEELREQVHKAEGAEQDVGT